MVVKPRAVGMVSRRVAVSVIQRFDAAAAVVLPFAIPIAFRASRVDYRVKLIEGGVNRSPGGAVSLIHCWV